MNCSNEEASTRVLASFISVDARTDGVTLD
jgi:hypothetical protein